MNREIATGAGSIYPLIGDISSTAGSSLVDVVGIQGIPVQQAFLSGDEVYFYDSSVNMWVPRLVEPTDLPIATTSSLGVVEPDGTTITIASGVITAVGGGGGITRSAVTTNSSGSYYTWSDGYIEAWGSISVTSSGNEFNSSTIFFPVTFPTAVQSIVITGAGLPDSGSTTDTFEVIINTFNTSQALIKLQCSVPTGGGGANFTQTVQIFWRAVGN